MIDELVHGDRIEIDHDELQKELIVGGSDETDMGVVIAHAIGLKDEEENVYSLTWIEGNDKASLEAATEDREYEVMLDDISKL